MQKSLQCNRPLLCDFQWTMRAFLVLLLISFGGFCTCEDVQGPSFVKEPPSRVDFSNTTGVTVDCAADGEPRPTMSWITSSGESVTSIPGLRQQLPGGALMFPAFSGADFRQDVHSATYRCVAANSAGVIISRDTHIRAVVPQAYEIQVFDVYAIVKTTAVLKCQVPSFLDNYVKVTMWLRDEVLIIEPTSLMDGKYAVLPTGELHIRDVSLDDSGSSYRCHVKHQLTGKTHFSSVAGRLHVTDPQANVQPRITDNMGSVHVNEGETVILPCVAQGHPAPKAEWFAKLNKRQLFPLHIGERVQQTSGILIIHRAQTSDSGTYVCDVSNEAGSDRAETTVTVTAPLSVSVKPAKQVVDIGKPATFRCLMSGFPVTSVTWYKDGKKLSTDSGRTVSDEIIYIESVQVLDKGMYQCFVNNNLESAQAVGQLLLGDAAPEFVGVFEDNILQPGMTATLVCVATGSPLPRVTWSVDGTPLSGLERVTTEERVDDDGSVASMLNITDVRWEDGGVYRCTAKNKEGQSEHEARVNVYGSPAIRKMPRVTAVAGEDIRLNCLFYGYPIESISWEKDGRALPFNLRQVAFPNGTVVIRKVQRASDTGKYSCTISNGKGQTAKEEVELAVMVPPKITPFSFQDELVREGMRARLQCVVSEGDAPLTLRWIKDGQAIPASLGVTVRDLDEYSSILSISHVTPRYNGNYTCIATNEAAAARHTAELFVNVPPRWIIEPRDNSVLLGNSLNVDCQADGFPLPRITWMKGQGNTVGEHVEPVENSSDVRVLANGTLSIPQVKEHHRGHYFCKASNGIGDGLSTALFINVLIPPRFDVKFRNQTFRGGEGFRLDCMPDGDQPFTFTWKKDEVLLDPALDVRYKIQSPPHSSISDLSIMEATRVDTGVYTCIAQNNYGVDETSLRIIVFEPPDPPADIKVQDIGNRSVEVTWTPPFDGHSPINKYVIEYSRLTDEGVDGQAEMAVSGKESLTVIHSMRPATRYQLRMFAENEIGISNPGNFVEFVTVEEAPGGVPLDIEVNAVDSTTIQVAWKPPKKDLWHGKLKGYYVGYKVLGSSEQVVFQSLELPPDEPSENLTAYITDLKKFTKYSIMVLAYNDKGRGPASTEVTVMTAEDVPGQAPMDVRCTPLTSQSIHVTWQPPPPHTVNGILRGYKVLFMKVAKTLSGDESPIDTKTTSVVRTTLHELEKSSNYSIQVVAFTKVGDGVPSSPIYCLTLDDVPDVPANVKAFPASKDSVLVAWKSPLRSNGVVNKYYVYAKHVDDAEEDAMRHAVPASALYYELSGLKPFQTYEFWVTAATSIGESPRSKMVSQAPEGPVVPAKIAAFDGTITTLWKKYIKLPCKAVGTPAPERFWMRGGVTVKENDRLKILPDGTLLVKYLEWSDSGNYTCRVKNDVGTDEVVYVVSVLAPPSTPNLNVGSTTPSSIALEWKLESDGGAAIQGYTLNFKRDLGHWEQVDLTPDMDSYSLNGLKCGNQYLLYMTAFNKIGTGSPSAVINVTTNGTAPERPPKEALIEEDIGSVTIHLQAWNTESCPITSFVLEYRQKPQSGWKLLADNLKAEQENFVITDLAPATPYSLRVTAHNGAGSTVATYDFVTLSRQGVGEDTRGILFYLDLRIIIPVAALVFLVVVILSILCICASRRDSAARKMKESQEKPIPYATYHLPNMRTSSEFTTFGQQRNPEQNSSSPPSQQPSQTPQNEVEDSNSHAMQHFTRPQPTVSGYPSPNGKMRTIHPVAIPTAPTASSPGDSGNGTYDSQGSPINRRKPDISPKLNMVTMETRFSPTTQEKLKDRGVLVLPGQPPGTTPENNTSRTASPNDRGSPPSTDFKDKNIVRFQPTNGPDVTQRSPLIHQ